MEKTSAGADRADINSAGSTQSSQPVDGSLCENCIQVHNEDFLPFGHTDSFEDVEFPVNDENKKETFFSPCLFADVCETGLKSGRKFKMFEGKIADDIFSGLGEEYCTDGSRLYYGSFLNGEYSGNGVLYNNPLVYKNSNMGTIIYAGCFKNGKFSGDGVLFYNEYRYISSFSDLSIDYRQTGIILVSSINEVDQYPVHTIPFLGADWSDVFKVAQSNNCVVRYNGKMKIIHHTDEINRLIISPCVNEANEANDSLMEDGEYPPVTYSLLKPNSSGQAHPTSSSSCPKMNDAMNNNVFTPHGRLQSKSMSSLSMNNSMHHLLNLQVNTADCVTPTVISSVSSSSYQSESIHELFTAEAYASVKDSSSIFPSSQDSNTPCSNRLSSQDGVIPRSSRLSSQDDVTSRLNRNSYDNSTPRLNRLSSQDNSTPRLNRLSSQDGLTPRSFRLSSQDSSTPRFSRLVSQDGITPRSSRLVSQDGINVQGSFYPAQTPRDPPPSLFGNSGVVRSQGGGGVSTPRVLRPMSSTPKAYSLLSSFASAKASVAHAATAIANYDLFFIPDGEGIEYLPSTDIKYKGRFKDGVYHGQGLYNFLNGDTFNGLFAYGRIAGKGKYNESARKIIFEGDFRNNVISGIFRVSLKDGYTIYCGELEDSIMHGRGYVSDRFIRDLYYEGSFRNGCIDSNLVRIIYKNELLYEGMIHRNWKKEQESDMDSVFLWNYENKVQHINAFLFNQNRSSSYMSSEDMKELTNDLYEGLMELKASINMICVGKYHSMSFNVYALLLRKACYQPNQQGCIYYSEKSKEADAIESESLLSVPIRSEYVILYRGFFDHGDFCDIGTLYNVSKPDTCVYTGLFSKNLFHGDGLLFDCNGCSYSGVFQNGVLIGDAKVYNRSHRLVYEGGIDNMLRFHEVGCFWFEDRSCFCGVWSHQHLVSNDCVYYEKETEESQIKWKGRTEMMNGVIDYNAECCCYSGSGVFYYRNGDYVTVSYENGKILEAKVKIYSSTKSVVYYGYIDTKMRASQEGVVYLRMEEGGADYPWLNREYTQLAARSPSTKRRSSSFLSLLTRASFRSIEYEGSLENGYAEGDGVYYGDDFSINGQWKKGHLVFGTEYNHKTIVYKGDYANNQWNGYGELYRKGVLEYKGYVHNGVPDGIGVLYQVNGRILYSGSFSQGVYQGNGTLYYPDSPLIHYLGIFDDGKACGFIKEFDERGTLVYKGEYYNNRRNGLGRLYDMDHVYEGVFHDDMLDLDDVTIWKKQDEWLSIYSGKVKRGNGEYMYIPINEMKRESKTDQYLEKENMDLYDMDLPMVVKENTPQVCSRRGLHGSLPDLLIGETPSNSAVSTLQMRKRVLSASFDHSDLQHDCISADKLESIRRMSSSKLRRSGRLDSASSEVSSIASKHHTPASHRSSTSFSQNESLSAFFNLGGKSYAFDDAMSVTSTQSMSSYRYHKKSTLNTIRHYINESRVPEDCQFTTYDLYEYGNSIVEKDYTTSIFSTSFN